MAYIHHIMDADDNVVDIFSQALANEIAEKFNTTRSYQAEDYVFHAEGYLTIASGDSSHAEGYSTTVSRDRSHAEGRNTKVSEVNAHAEGYGTVVNRRSMHVFGEFNDITNVDQAYDTKGAYIEMVGNGTSTSSRSNARTLDWSGNEYLQENLTLRGTQIKIGQTTIIETQLKSLLALLN